jgi:hypothetical protein
MGKKNKKITVSLINPYIFNNNGENMYKLKSKKSIDEAVKELYGGASKHFSNSILNKNFCISVKVIDENNEKQYLSYSVNDVFTGGSSKTVKYTITKLDDINLKLMKKVSKKKKEFIKDINEETVKLGGGGGGTESNDKTSVTSSNIENDGNNVNV